MAEIAGGAMQGGGMGLKEYGDFQLKKKALETQTADERAWQEKQDIIKHERNKELARISKSGGGQTLDLTDLLNAQRVVSGLETTPDTVFSLPEGLTASDFEEDDNKTFKAKFVEKNPSILTLPVATQTQLIESAFEQAKTGYSAPWFGSNTYTQPKVSTITIPGQKGVYDAGTAQTLGITGNKLTVGKKTDGDSKQITPALAQEFLQKAGGDKDKARKLAKAAGYTF